MEKETPQPDIDTWYASLSPEEKEKLFNGVAKIDKPLKCIDPHKRSHLELSWKPELSEDTTTLKYEESESGMFYETHSILEYIQDCRQRKRRVTEAIRDFELIHREREQKLFLWVSDTFCDIIDTFSVELHKFLSDQSSKKVNVSVDAFEDKYVIMTNIIVGGYEHKVELLKAFKATIDTKLAEPISVYFDNKPEPHEKIPSVANEGYKNPSVVELVSNGYRLNSVLLEQLKSVAASQFSDGQNVQIVINIVGCTFNNFATTSESNYSKFVEYILTDKPEWYKPNEWLPKSILVEKFNEKYGTDISSQVFMRRMHSEGLMTKISEQEKRAKLGGKIKSVFFCKNI